MAERIVVIQGHPDPDPGRYCRALAAAYAAGAEAAGHGVTVVDVARLDFPLLRARGDFEHGQTPEALRPAQEAIAEATHLALVFPLWLGTMPALLKGFLEQTFRPGFAFDYGPGGRARQRMAGRSARVVVTMGMPALAYRLVYMAHGVRGLERNILHFVGIGPVRETLIGMVEGVSDAKRRRWIDRMRQLGARAR